MQRTLNDGSTIDRLGFGLYKVAPEDVGRVVRDGLDVGFRRIDGARFYGNEAAFGEALEASGLRDEVTVTSKFWGDPEQSGGACRRDVADTLRDLRLDAVDIYMIHWPRATRGRFIEVWETMLELQREGRIGTVAVANFSAEELDALVAATGVAPAINQVELHPYLQQEELRAYHDAHGIATEAWSPLGRGEVLRDAAIVRIAQRRGITPAQVILRWHLDVGNLVIPKSLQRARLEENRKALDVELTDEDHAVIAGLECGRHFGTTSADRQ